MSWADLEKLQGAKRPDGTMMVVARDDRAASAIVEKRSLSILFAISRVIHGRNLVAEKYGGKGRVVYTTAGMPPAFLIEAVCAAGGIVFDGKSEHALAKPPEVGMLLDGTFCDFAIEVKRRFKVRTMRDALEVREIELRKKPVDVADPVARWTAIYELMALVGEAAREKRPGRWSIDEQDTKVSFPLVLDLGRGYKLAPGRLAAAVVYGTATTTIDLLSLAEKGEATLAADPATTIPLLHDRRTLPADSIVTEPLVDNETDSPELPVVAYVEDREEGYRWPEDAPITAALRQRALANLGRRAFEIDLLELSFGMQVAVVSGDFYAAEAILHRPTMKRVEQKLGSEALLVGVPARGFLFAMDAAAASADNDMLTAFLLFVEKQYLENAEAARISSELVVYQGKPIGRVQSNLMDTRRALRRMGIDPDA